MHGASVKIKKSLVDIYIVVPLCCKICLVHYQKVLMNPHRHLYTLVTENCPDAKFLDGPLIKRKV